MGMREDMERDLSTENKTQTREVKVIMQPEPTKRFRLPKTLKNKEYSPRDLRHEVYDYVEKNVGKLTLDQKAYLSGLMREMCKIHNITLVTLTQNLKNRVDQLKFKLKYKK